ncbi:MAG: hypothetical protein J6Q27_01070, partial [Clostridia bacterium]|nr:hypothetical protein [Clostridia bacterium]
QKVEICVARADSMSGRIDFVLHKEGDQQKRRKNDLMEKKHKQVRRNHGAKIKTARYLKKKHKKR